MTHALLYQPRRQWRIAFAFAAAAVIHFGAIAIANVHRAQASEIGSAPDEFPTITFEDVPPPDDLQPEPVEPLSTPPPAEESFAAETSTPPPVRHLQSRPIAPVQPRVNQPPGKLTWSSARVLAVSAPRPEYPYEARCQKVTGDGVVAMTIDTATGNVTNVVMQRSTGNAFLDNAALSGFRRWRFRPGTVSSVACPITFTLAGALY